MAAFCVVTLMKASSCNYCRPTRAAPGETLGSGLPDRTMAVQRCRFLSWEHRLWSSAGRQRQEVERLRLARSFGGDVKSCLADRCYALSCLVGRCYARQIFQRLQAVSAGGTWRHGAELYRWRPRRAQLFARREVVPLGVVVASTAARPGNVDASVQL
jgi:hypothetical protein